jgi:hypothetical protein
MKEINLPSGNYLFVKVPDDAYDFKIGEALGNKVIWYEFHPNLNKAIIPIPSQINYEVISTTKDITEEQAGSIVEFDEINGEHPDFVNGVAWLNYKRNRYEYNRVFTVKESLQSLIQANGLDINKNYLILRMI